MSPIAIIDVLNRVEGYYPKNQRIIVHRDVQL